MLFILLFIYLPLENTFGEMQVKFLPKGLNVHFILIILPPIVVNHPFWSMLVCLSVYDLILAGISQNF